MRHPSPLLCHPPRRAAMVAAKYLGLWGQISSLLVQGTRIANSTTLLVVETSFCQYFADKEAGPLSLKPRNNRCPNCSNCALFIKFRYFGRTDKRSIDTLCHFSQLLTKIYHLYLLQKISETCSDIYTREGRKVARSVSRPLRILQTKLAILLRFQHWKAR